MGCRRVGRRVTTKLEGVKRTKGKSDTVKIYMEGVWVRGKQRKRIGQNIMLVTEKEREDKQGLVTKREVKMEGRANPKTRVKLAEHKKL